MFKNSHLRKLNSGAGGIGCLLAAMVCFGLGCGSSGNLIIGQHSAGQTSIGGQIGGAQGGNAGNPQGGTNSTAVAGTGGQNTGLSSLGGGTGGAGTRSASEGGGGKNTGGASNTGGVATGGSTSASSKSPRDGGLDALDASVPDLRKADGTVPIRDGGPIGPFCPSDGTACKIMPLGDSITDGSAYPGGYRIPLLKLALTDKKHITFVGRNSNGPASITFDGQSVNFPQGHEGYSGWNIEGIYNKVDGATQANMPHIVLLMIGTNDVDRSMDLANAPARMGTLLDKLAADAPNTLVVVAKIVPSTDDGNNARAQTYNDGIEPIIESRISQGRNLKMVDMYAAFTANANFKTELMNDKLHPKDAGYAIMAQTWYDAIKTYLH